MDVGIDGLVAEEVIGRGGFGAVYRAVDDAHGRLVAVKLLDPVLDDRARRRFDRERRAMGRLSGHPNIVVVHTSGFTESHQPYLVMELLSRGSLADRLRVGPMPVDEVLDMAVDLADALAQAHALGVLHLDLKPANVLLSDFGRPKITDFGIAALVGDDSATTTIRATPAYADPDVLDGKPPTERSDVYGLAGTLYALLAGHPPYSQDTESAMTVLRRVATEPVPSLRRTDLPAGLGELLAYGMAKESDDRLATMRELADRLREIRDGVDQAPRSAPAAPRTDPDSPTAAVPLVAWTELESGSGSTAADHDASRPTGDPSRRRSPLVWAAPVAALGVLVAGWMAFTGDDGIGDPPTTVAAAPNTATADGAVTDDPAPEGTTPGDTSIVSAPRSTLPLTATPSSVSDGAVPPPPAPGIDDIPVAPSDVTAGISATNGIWSLAVDDAGVPTDPRFVIPEGVPVLCYSFDYVNVPIGVPFTVDWFADGVLQPQASVAGINEGETASTTAACISDPSGLVAGVYEVAFTVDGTSVFGASTYVGGDRSLLTVTFVNQSPVDLCGLYWVPTGAQGTGLNQLAFPIASGDSVPLSLQSGNYQTFVFDCEGNIRFEESVGTELFQDLPLTIT